MGKNEFEAYLDGNEVRIVRDDIHLKNETGNKEIGEIAKKYLSDVDNCNEITKYAVLLALEVSGYNFSEESPKVKFKLNFKLEDFEIIEPNDVCLHISLITKVAHDAKYQIRFSVVIPDQFDLTSEYLSQDYDLFDFFVLTIDENE